MTLLLNLSSGSCRSSAAERLAVRPRRRTAGLTRRLVLLLWLLLRRRTLLIWRLRLPLTLLRLAVRRRTILTLSSRLELLRILRRLVSAVPLRLAVLLVVLLLGRAGTLVPLTLSLLAILTLLLLTLAVGRVLLRLLERRLRRGLLRSLRLRRPGDLGTVGLGRGCSGGSSTLRRLSLRLSGNSSDPGRSGAGRRGRIGVTAGRRGDVEDRVDVGGNGLDLRTEFVLDTVEIVSVLDLRYQLRSSGMTSACDMGGSRSGVRWPDPSDRIDRNDH